jgi:hypothetical protein
MIRVIRWRGWASSIGLFLVGFGAFWLAVWLRSVPHSTAALTVDSYPPIAPRLMVLAGILILIVTSVATLVRLARRLIEKN